MPTRVVMRMAVYMEKSAMNQLFSGVPLKKAFNVLLLSLTVVLRYFSPNYVFLGSRVIITICDDKTKNVIIDTF